MIGYQSNNKFVLNLSEEIKNNKQDFSPFGGSPEGRQYIPLVEAGKILGTSRDYLNVLVRRKKLHAVKLGRNWFTTNAWLSEYKSSIGKNGSGFSIAKFEQDEKAELASLREASLAERLQRVESHFNNVQTFKDKEVVKKISTFIASQEIKLSSRQMALDEKTRILETVKERIKATGSEQFQNASKKLGIYKSLKSWSTKELSVASGFAALALVVSLFVVSGLITIPNFNFPKQNIKYEASIPQFSN